MKILHINGLGYFGGAENLAYLIAKEQMEMGNDVTIAYMAKKSVYGLRAEKEGIKTIEFGMHSGLDILNFKKYVKFIKRENFNVIHDHNGPPLVRLSKLFCRNAIFIQHIHGTKFGNIRWEKRSVLLWKRLTNCLVDHWLANSNHIKSIAIIKEKIPLSKISVVYNGLNLNSFKPSKNRKEMRKELGISDNEFVVGTVGKLNMAKGIDKILAVAKDIDVPPQRDPDTAVTKFVIVGDGELRKELERLRDTLHLKEKVIFTGNREDIPDVLSAFDIFLSTSQWEAFGIALIEAMAIGVPIVAFAVGGVPEVVNHECGILIPPNNLEKMKEAINYLKENKSIMTEMGKSGIKRVKEKFTLSKKVEELHSLYLKAIRK